MLDVPCRVPLVVCQSDHVSKMPSRGCQLHIRAGFYIRTDFMTPGTPTHVKHNSEVLRTPLGSSSSDTSWIRESSPLGSVEVGVL